MKRWIHTELRRLALTEMLDRVEYVMTEEDRIAESAHEATDTGYTSDDLVELVDVLERAQQRVAGLLTRARAVRERIEQGAHWSQRKPPAWP